MSRLIFNLFKNYNSIILKLNKWISEQMYVNKKQVFRLQSDVMKFKYQT